MKERNNDIHMLLTDQELEQIHQKMELSGITSRSAYLRKMALDGYCINLNLPELKEMLSLLRRCSNNLNQYARRANEAGSIYEIDIKDLQELQEKIWDSAKKILSGLAEIK